MVHGLFVAMLVSLVWILLQNLSMHFRPMENRFKPMVLGYLLSLPFVFVFYRWLPPLSVTIASMMQSEAWGMGLFHAYLLHLLFFFFYVQCFYHVERSVTLRILVELLKHGEQDISLDGLQQQYSLEEMINNRLEVMRDRGLVEFRDGRWHLRLKGTLLAQAAAAGAWLFQAKHQHERM